MPMVTLIMVMNETPGPAKDAVHFISCSIMHDIHRIDTENSQAVKTGHGACPFQQL